MLRVHVPYVVGEMSKSESKNSESKNSDEEEDGEEILENFISLRISEDELSLVVKHSSATIEELTRAFVKVMRILELPKKKKLSYVN